jgi:hypothetical protein
MKLKDLFGRRIVKEGLFGKTVYEITDDGRIKEPGLFGKTVGRVKK